MTLFDCVTQCMAHDFNKNGPFGVRGGTLEEYIDWSLNRMTRMDFLRAISDALEERLQKEKGDGAACV
jgi:hypothetical protein